MTYAGFKSYVNTLLIGDRRTLPEDSDLKNLLGVVLREVASEYEPLSLTTQKKDADILKVCENGHYILVPSIPISDSEDIKMDEGLIYVVCYKVALSLASKDKKEEIKEDMWTHINNYVWDRYETDFNAPDEKTAIDTNLDQYGFKKIYINKVETSNGISYEWDLEFIELLNSYLTGKPLYAMTKSDKRNLDKFISLNDGSLDQNSEDYDAFVQLNKYLGSL